MKTPDAVDVLGVVGVGSLTLGAALIYLPLAFIVLGLAALVAANFIVGDA